MGLITRPSLSHRTKSECGGSGNGKEPLLVTFGFGVENKYLFIRFIGKSHEIYCVPFAEMCALFFS